VALDAGRARPQQGVRGCWIWGGLLAGVLVVALGWVGWLVWDLVQLIEPVQPYAGRLGFRISEKTVGDERVPQPNLRLSAGSSVLCMPSIVSHTTVQRGRIDVQLEGLRGIALRACPQLPYPAIQREPLDLRPREYTLRFTNGTQTDQYQLTVTAGSLAVSPTSGAFTYTDLPQIYRYPRSSLAYLCGTARQNTWICDHFLALLRAEVSLQEFSFPPEGVVPYPW
jgi:hypothetical protein